MVCDGWFVMLQNYGPLPILCVCVSGFSGIRFCFSPGSGFPSIRIDHTCELGEMCRNLALFSWCSEFCRFCGRLCIFGGMLMMISFSERGPLSGEEFENVEVEGKKEARSPSRTFANA